MPMVPVEAAVGVLVLYVAALRSFGAPVLDVGIDAGHVVSEGQPFGAMQRVGRVPADPVILEIHFVGVAAFEYLERHLSLADRARRCPVAFLDRRRERETILDLHAAAVVRA